MSAPTRPKGHDEYEALAVAWAIDALEPADQEEFEAHRDGCDRCTLAVVSALQVATELAYGVPDVDPPPWLRERVLAAATSRLPAPGVSPEGMAGREAARQYAERRGPPRTGNVGEVGRGDADGKDLDAEDISSSRTAGGRNADDKNADSRNAGNRNADNRNADNRNVDNRNVDSRDGGGRDGGSGQDVVREVRRRTGGGAHRSTSRRPAGRPGAAPSGGTGRGDGGPSGRNPGRWVRSRRGALSVLAAVALVGLSAVTTWEVTRPAAVTAPTAAAERVATLTTQAGDRTLGTLVARDGGADLVTDGLAPNAGRGTDYVVWGVPAGRSGRPQVVGRVTVTDEGLHSYPVRLTQPLDDYPVVAISEEAAGSTPTAPSRVLGRGALGR